MIDEFNIQIGRVCYNIDPTGAGRLKVKIQDDRKILDIQELPWAFPLIPKMLHIIPQVDETVLIFTLRRNEPSDRFWVGPIIPLLNMLGLSNHHIESRSIFSDSFFGSKNNPTQHKDSQGVYPNINDVGLLGKENTDVLLKNNEIWIRAGKYIKVGENEIFNETPTYIQLKNEKRVDNDNKTYNTSINVVADRINLLSTQSNDKFNLANKDDLISQEEMKSILERAHALPYGDVLVEFLQLFIKAFATHTHPYPGMFPNLDTNFKALLNFNLSDILSQTIKIN